MLKAQQDMNEASEVVRYLLTVRAEYFFLVVLHHSFLQDHPRVLQEIMEFSRYIMSISCGL